MILIDATPLQSEHRLRGVGAYLRSLIDAIEASGDSRKPRVHYLASNVGAAHVRELPAERVRFVPRPHRPAQIYWLYNEIWLRAALWRWQPRVLVAPDFNGLATNPFGATLAVLHDLTELRMQRSKPPERGVAGRLSQLRWKAYHRKLQGADAVLAISHDAKRDAVRLLGLPEERVAVIHHGVDHTRYRPLRDTDAHAGEPPFLLNLGGRNANKNQERLLSAFARISVNHPKLQLLFAGPWRDGDLLWLTRASRRLGVEGRVRHLGYVPAAELPNLYGRALGFVFPSLAEGFGMPVLEAMASGTPVITSNRSSLPEVAGDAALLVEPTDVHALAIAMDSLVGDPALRERYIAKGLARAAEFTWERTAANTLELAFRLAERA